MPRVIDGDNLLGTWPGRCRGDEEKSALAREVNALRCEDASRILLVFDGPAPPDESFGPDVAFSGRGCTADTLILDHLRGEADPKNWAVVTNDRSLADRCRALGARIEAVRDFRQRLKR